MTEDEDMVAFRPLSCCREGCFARGEPVLAMDDAAIWVNDTVLSGPKVTEYGVWIVGPTGELIELISLWGAFGEADAWAARLLEDRRIIADNRLVAPCLEVAADEGVDC